PTSPCSAARRSQSAALAGSRSTPRPSRNAAPMLLCARAWPRWASGAHRSRATPKLPAFQATSAWSRRRSAPNILPSHDMKLVQLRGECRLVVERAQVEVERAVADAADHGNRQAAKGSGQAIEALAA